MAALVNESMVAKSQTLIKLSDKLGGRTPGTISSIRYL